MMIQVDDVHVFTASPDAGDSPKTYEFPQKLSNVTVWAIARNQMQAEELLAEYVEEKGLSFEDFFLASVTKEGEEAPTCKQPQRRFSHDRLLVLRVD